MQLRMDFWRMVGKAIALLALAASEESVSSNELPSSTLTCLLLGAATALLAVLLVLWPCCGWQQGNLLVPQID